MRRYSVVIPTRGNREDTLRKVLSDVRSQDFLPNRVVVVTAPNSEGFDPSEEMIGIPSMVVESPVASAAQQRNLGASETDTPLIVFLDDDVRIGPHVIETLITALEYRDAGGIAARMEGGEHRKPGIFSRAYYRLQSGYSHPHYGSRVIGPAITTFPCYEWEPDDLIESDWLNSACVVYDRTLFDQVGGFPDFEGASPFEDVHLSLRVGQKRPLFFHRQCVFTHPADEEAGGDQSYEMGRMFIRNQRRTARELLDLSPVSRESKLLLHKLWISLSLIRRHPPGWHRRLLGTLFS